MAPRISFPYHVTLQDGREVDVTALAPDLIRMESRFGVTWAAICPGPLLNPVTGAPVTTDDGDVLIDPSTSQIRLEYVAFMAWSAMRRTHVDVDERFETFRDSQLADVHATDEEPTADEVDDPEGPAGSAG